jgi:dinuclear metal center YbgI/SA1388 family protein
MRRSKEFISSFVGFCRKVPSLMRIADVAAAIEKIAPLALAQSWDNVGLLVGRADTTVRTILLTIDVTRQVLKEAKRSNADLIVSYHPVIWDGLKRVTADGPSRIVYELIGAGVAVFSVHTALDAAVGGVNDGLAQIVGIEKGAPIGDYVTNPAAESYKLVVFVPRQAAEKVAEAVFAAGAGVMGNYSHCSFRTSGEGSFLPLAGARPAVGKPGRLEKVEEIRFEAIVPAAKVGEVVSAMRKAHPYEVPAFDVIKLYNVESYLGLGRMGRLAKPARVKTIVQRIKKHTGAKAIGIVGTQQRMVATAAVCAGYCGKLISSVIEAGCDLYVTGELKHHQALAAQQAGLTCICLSHTVSERFILKKFARQLQKLLADVTIRVSKKDQEPFVWKNI